MEKNTIKAAFKKKFFNADGTLNKTVVTSFITLLILLVQQVLTIFGVKFTGDWSQIVGAINTVLAILTAAGFVEGNGEVELPTTKLETKSDSLGQKAPENVQKGDDNYDENAQTK